MKPYYESGGITIYHGDCREIIPQLGSFETCITDPPYGLEFMGKDWDRGVPGVEFWKIIACALKPGAQLLAFGGTRTFHRLACAIEDAGFEIRDCLMWLYGSGFPKSLDISKAIDKAAGAEREVVGPPTLGGKGQGNAYGVITRPPATAPATVWNGFGTALKPAWEPCIVAMKPLDGTFAENAQKHGVAGLNIDGGRISTEGGSPAAQRRESARRSGNTPGKPGEYGRTIKNRISPGAYLSDHPGEAKGRWPANLVLDEEAARMLDEQSGEVPGQLVRARTDGAAQGNTVLGALKHITKQPEPRGDSGGASRFFYTAKASGSERNEGYNVRNVHPTVKPLDLMRYLCILTSTPTGGVVLDPFMGSASTLVAARDCGRPAVGIEIDEKYCEIAVRRLAQEVLPFDVPRSV